MKDTLEDGYRKLDMKQKGQEWTSWVQSKFIEMNGNANTYLSASLIDLHLLGHYVDQI